MERQECGQGKALAGADPPPAPGISYLQVSQAHPLFYWHLEQAESIQLRRSQINFFLLLLAPASWELILVILEKAGIRRAGKAFNS